MHSIICQVCDTQSGVPNRALAHSTQPDTQDVLKVVGTVLQNKFLTPTPGRKQSAFLKLHLDPLHKWNSEKTKSWIEKKKVDIDDVYMQSEDDCSEDDANDEETEDD